MPRILDSTQIIGEVILLTQCIYSGVCSCMTTVNCTNACWIFQISNSIFFPDKKGADAISSELFRKSSEHLVFLRKVSEYFWKFHKARCQAFNFSLSGESDVSSSACKHKHGETNTQHLERNLIYNCVHWLVVISKLLFLLLN